MPIQFSQNIEILGTVLFGCAVLHTFFVKQILDFSHRFEKGSAMERSFHLLSEIEVVFGLWAGLFMALFAVIRTPMEMVNYQESLNFTEPIFVFCIMVISASKPVLQAARKAIQYLSAILVKVLRLPRIQADMFVLLFVGPLAGSFITEPAAMTVSALLLNSMLKEPEKKFMYALLAVLFVNISIGGALTSFAAPPILMVANTWNWNSQFVFSHFGWKSMIACFVNAVLFVIIFRKQIALYCNDIKSVLANENPVPVLVTLVHYLFLAGIVLVAHYPSLTMGLFLFFIGLTTVTAKHQTFLRLKESLLVAFFLAGLIVFGAFQRWWLEPLLTSMGNMELFFGAAGLTAITDNAALTYLGSQVPGLSDSSKYYLVAGAITGGGLTIIANAPNPAGYSILQQKFIGGMSPLGLLVAAIPFTLVAALFLGFLPV